MKHIGSYRALGRTHDKIAAYLAALGIERNGDESEDIEKGLASLKSMAEGLPSADFSDIEIEHIVVEATDIAYQPTSSVPEASAISDAMGKAFFNILGFIDENKLQEAGAPLSIIIPI